MSQRARPVADIANDGWTPVPLYRQLDEQTPSDATRVTSPYLPPARTFAVRLDRRAAPVAGPPRAGTAAPAHRLTLRLQGSCGAAVVATLYNHLRGADRFVAARTLYPAGGFADYEVTLTRREAARVEDYATLQVVVTAFESSSSSCPSSSSSAGSSRSGHSSEAPSAGSASANSGASGSGAARGGSSSDSVSRSRPAVPRTPICNNRSLPTIVYATFGGALSPWGTVALHFSGIFGGKYIWGMDVRLPTILRCGLLNQLVSFYVCGESVVDPPDGYMRSSVTVVAGQPCAAYSDTFGLVPIQSYDPFFAEDGGLMGYTGQPSPNGCPCEGEPWSVMYTETPP